MKPRLLILFLCLGPAVFAQSTDKCMTSYAYFSLTVFEAGGTGTLVYDSRGYPGTTQSDQPDTLFYALAEGDSAVATFHALDEMGMFYWEAGTSPMAETLIYGTLVYDQVYNGFNGLGPSYEAIWSFTDSALFEFVTPMNSAATGVVKLTKKQEQAAVAAETDDVAFSVCPNPFADELFVRMPEETPTEFSLIDAAGKALLEWRSGVSHTVDVSGLRPGMYLLQMRGAGKTGTLRFQKL